MRSAEELNGLREREIDGIVIVAHKAKQRTPIGRMVMLPCRHDSRRGALLWPKRDTKPSYMKKCVLEPEIPRVSSEIHPLAVLMIMPLQRVFPPVNILFADKTYHSQRDSLETSIALSRSINRAEASVQLTYIYPPNSM